MLRALLIRHPHIDKILDGKKTWEIRGSRISLQERIALIPSGSGTIIGVCDVAGCQGPLAFTKKLNAEEKRGLAEQLTEEELVIFDLLTKPNITLTQQEAAEVKKVSRSLLEKLKQEKLVLDWRKQQTTRAMVLVTIQDVLNELPRVYSKDLYDQKCDVVYQHFYESYMGQGRSAYGVN